MMRGMFAAISGLKVHQTMLDIAANDIANVNTVGFKGERASFKDALSQLQRGASGPSTNLGGTNALQVGLGVQLASIDKVMGAGGIQQTGNPLDLAIQGDGFFRVAEGDGGTGLGADRLYTRAGNFTLDSDANLVTQDGMFVVGYAFAAGVLTTTETRITVPAGGVGVGDDAVGTLQKLAQITLAKFPNEAGLERVSGNRFRESNNSGPEVVGVPGDVAVGTGSLAPGAVEMSNVDLAQEFTTMITAQRGFQANSRVISATDEMLQQLVNLGR
jgi:flagellar hook protein FlgE